MFKPFCHTLPVAALLVLSACAGNSVAVVPCSEHCQTHEEGYQWALASNLSDDGACEGYSDDFVRGCRNGVEDFSQIRAQKEGF